MKRRTFIRHLAMAGLAGTLFPSMAFSNVLDAPLSGSLSIYNVNTREHLAVRYMDGAGKLVAASLASLDTIFRCKMTEKVARIDPGLYMLLDSIGTRLQLGDKPMELISGYRSPEYNSRRAAVNPGVSRNSYHVKGMAADIAVEGVSLKDMRLVAVDLAAGGVGSYSEFIHVDVGPVRTW